jgi:hypothetical protein
MYRFISLLTILSVLSCQRKPDPKDMVLQLRELNELATVEYTVSKIVKASDDQTWYKFGDRKILMSCRATIKAGIDLNGLQAKDIIVDGESISLELPDAQIFSVNLRPEDIRTEYEEVGIFRSEFSAAERNQLMAQGEAQIRRQAASTDILRSAETQASLLLGNFLRSLGYKEVKIRFQKQSPNPPRIG